MIPYGRQTITPQDIEAVNEALRSDFLTQGPKVPMFEQTVADMTGAKHAVAVNSATSALHISCRVLGVNQGDLVWTSPISFVASANCALYCGAKVDFVDIDPVTYNLSTQRLSEKLAHAKHAGALPKVVIPVHMCGQSCDMAGIRELSDRYGFKILEDASHAIGGNYRGEPIGSCRYSDVTVFSFHPVKIITTGEGGMALTNDDELADRMALLRSHGITRDPKKMTQPPDGPWYYQQIDLGYNYRMTDLQAALGLSQVRRLSDYIRRRNVLADRYGSLLAECPLAIPRSHSDTVSSWHLYVVRLKLEEITSTHQQVFEVLRNAGIGVNLHYIPIYKQPFFRKMGFKSGCFPEAEKYYQEAITLPLYPGLSKEQQRTIAASLKAALE